MGPCEGEKVGMGLAWSEPRFGNRNVLFVKLNGGSQMTVVLIC